MCCCMLMQITDSDLFIANVQLFILKSNSYVFMYTMWYYIRSYMAVHLYSDRYSGRSFRFLVEDIFGVYVSTIYVSIDDING